MDFQPTHKITFTPAQGEPSTWLVMLTDEGPAYTAEEWDDDANASWYVDDGHWYCEGQVTPGGENGEIEVERL